MAPPVRPTDRSSVPPAGSSPATDTVRTGGPVTAVRSDRDPVPGAEQALRRLAGTLAEGRLAGSGTLGPGSADGILPIIEPRPDREWMTDSGFYVWLKQNGLDQKRGDLALMPKVYGLYLLLRATTVDPFLIPTDRRTTFSSRSLGEKYLAMPSRARYAYEAFRETPSRRIPLIELATMRGVYFTLDEIKMAAALSWLGIGVPLYGVRTDEKDPARRVHSMLTADFSESLDLSMVGYDRSKKLTAQMRFNEATFDDLRRIRDFFVLFRVNADSGIRLALTPEGRLFVGNAADLVLFAGKDFPMLWHVFNLATDKLIPPTKLPADLAAWLYVGLIDLSGGDERVFRRMVDKLIGAGFDYFPDFDTARILFQRRDRAGLEGMVLRQMDRVRAKGTEPPPAPQRQVEKRRRAPETPRISPAPPPVEAPPTVPRERERPLSVSVTVAELAARLAVEEAEREAPLRSSAPPVAASAPAAVFDNRAREIKLARTMAELMQEHPEIYERNASGRNVTHLIRGRLSRFDLEKNIRVLFLRWRESLPKEDGGAREVQRSRFAVEIAGRIYDHEFLAGRPGTPIELYARTVFKWINPEVVVIPAHTFVALGPQTHFEGQFGTGKGFREVPLSTYAVEVGAEYPESCTEFADLKPRSEILQSSGTTLRAALSRGAFIFDFEGGVHLTVENYIAALRWQVGRLATDVPGLVAVELVIRLPGDAKMARVQFVQQTKAFFEDKGYKKGVALRFAVIGEEEERPATRPAALPPPRLVSPTLAAPRLSSPPRSRQVVSVEDEDEPVRPSSERGAGLREETGPLFDDPDSVDEEGDEAGDAAEVEGDREDEAAGVDAADGDTAELADAVGEPEPDDDETSGDGEPVPTDEPIRAPFSATRGGALTRGIAARKKVPAVNPRAGFYVADQQEIERAALPVFERLVREKSFAKAHVVAHHLSATLHAEFLSYVTGNPDAKRTAIFFDALANPERHKHRFYGNVSAKLLARRAEAVTDQAAEVRETLKQAMRDFLEGEYKNSAIILPTLSSDGRFLPPECQALHLWLTDSLYLIHEIAESREGYDTFRLEWMLAVRLQTLSKGDLVNALYGRNQARAPSSKNIVLLASHLARRTVAEIFNRGAFPDPVFDWQNFFMGHGRLLDAFVPGGDLEAEPHRLLARYWIIRFGQTDAASKHPADSFFTKGHLDRLDELIPQLAKLPKTLFSPAELKDARDFRASVVKWMGKRTGGVALFGKKPGDVSAAGIVFSDRTLSPFMRGDDHDLPPADSRGAAERSYWEIIATRGEVERRRPVPREGGHGPHRRPMDHRPAVVWAESWNDVRHFSLGLAPRHDSRRLAALLAGKGLRETAAFVLRLSDDDLRAVIAGGTGVVVRLLRSTKRATLAAAIQKGKIAMSPSQTMTLSLALASGSTRETEAVLRTILSDRPSAMASPHGDALSGFLLPAPAIPATVGVPLPR